VKQQDEELTEVAKSREQQSAREKSRSKSPGEISNGNEGEMIGPDIGLAFMEQKNQWEKQEELNKERTSLHYQDILFDEARSQKQQEALEKIRKETLEKQQQRENLKKTRDEVIANRVKAAKARVRGKLSIENLQYLN
jgi:hypothetical protein